MAAVRHLGFVMCMFRPPIEGYLAVLSLCDLIVSILCKF